MAGTMSPDTVSSLYPERPIRPLPKRRLRERLPADVADNIQYPPAPESSSQLFYYPYDSKDDYADHPDAVPRDRSDETARGGPRKLEKDEDDGGVRRVTLDRSLARTGRPLPMPESNRSTLTHLPPSTSSSADGYDAFENTNNKKKRKIPTAGDSVLHGHSLNEISAGIAGLSATGASDSRGDSAGTGHYGYSSGGAGISGPGRGRYGRMRTGRSPLRTLPDNSWASRNGKWAGESTGIISTAIATANAEKVPVTQGQENISLLQQQPPSQQQYSPRGQPRANSTEFNFSCNPQIPAHIPWPGADPKESPRPYSTGAYAQWREAQARTMSKPASTCPAVPAPLAQAFPSSAANPTAVAKEGTDNKQPKKKKTSRRKLNRELNDQARDRKREQEIWNVENQPSDSDIYICPLCEFESINGYKPKFLIRAFEMKERKKRLEAERRQRLLEKAKARGRKGRKAKAAPKSNAQPESQPQAEQRASSMDANPSEDTRSDDFEGDEGDYYEDDYERDEAAHEQDPDTRTAAASPPAVSSAGGGTAPGNADADAETRGSV